jgi:hypothetical protein
MRFALGSFLKLAAVAVFAVWVAGSNALLHPSGGAEVRASGLSLSNSTKSETSTKSPFTELSAAQETRLVALRGYLLTGSAGFKTEWAQAVVKADAAQAAIDRDSRSWTDGHKLLLLSEMRKTTAKLSDEEKILITIIATPNQFPGLRLYQEDVDPALAQAITLLNEILQSNLTVNETAAANNVGALARVRGDVRNLRQQLLAYLPSGDLTQPETLRTSLEALREAPATLGALRGAATAQDRERLTVLAALLQKADGRLDQIFALKKSPRWNYADYAFKQKVLPLTEQILKSVETLRGQS